MKINKSKHFKEMILERGIKDSWVESTLEFPDEVEEKDDGTTHYIKLIKEYGNRWLRIILNTQKLPPMAITVFFDRRIKEK
ncbi:MAG: DUF4258 domain-containing protein [Fidelibacterota bacterium]